MAKICSHRAELSDGRSVQCSLPAGHRGVHIHQAAETGIRVWLVLNGDQFGEVVIEPGEAVGFTTQLLEPRANVSLVCRMTESEESEIVIELAGEVFDQAVEEPDKKPTLFVINGGDGSA